MSHILNCMPFKDKIAASNCQKEFYSKNTEYYKQKRKENRLKIRDFISNLKKEAKCKFCNECESVCLQFHHLDQNEKEIEIADIRNKGWSIKRLQTEIDKCVIVCANCHFKIHANIIRFAD